MFISKPPFNKRGLFYKLALIISEINFIMKVETIASVRTRRKYLSKWIYPPIYSDYFRN